MDDHQAQFIQDIAGLALLVLQAVFHGKVLFDNTASSDPGFQATHAAVIQAKNGLSTMVAAAQQ